MEECLPSLLTLLGSSLQHSRKKEEERTVTAMSLNSECISIAFIQTLGYCVPVLK